MKPTAIALLSLAIFFTSGCTFLATTKERRNADRIIAGVEGYTKTHGSPPDPGNIEVMESLGFEMRAEWQRDPNYQGSEKCDCGGPMIAKVRWHPAYQVDEKRLYRVSIIDGAAAPYWTYRSSSSRWSKDSEPVDNTIDPIAPPNKRRQGNRR